MMNFFATILSSFILYVLKKDIFPRKNNNILLTHPLYSHEDKKKVQEMARSIHTIYIYERTLNMVTFYFHAFLVV